MIYDETSEITENVWNFLLRRAKMNEASSPQAILAKELGARVVESRINYLWAMGFPSMEKATIFAGMLTSEGKQVRGPHDFGSADPRGIAVGWRV